MHLSTVKYSSFKSIQLYSLLLNCEILSYLPSVKFMSLENYHVNGTYILQFLWIQVDL